MAAGRDSLPREARLRGEGSFASVFAHRRSVSDASIVLYGRPRPGGGGWAGPRLGLSVSRKVGTAVARNRWKRRIREAFRRICRDLPEGNDFVVVARTGRVPTQDAMEQSIVALARRLLDRRGYFDLPGSDTAGRGGARGGEG